MFHHQRKNTGSPQTKLLKDLTRFLGVTQFLAENKRQVLLKKMKDLSGLESSRYESLCSNLIANLVNYCQSLPEASNTYYSQSGGLVDYALNRTEAALDLFKDFMVQEEATLFSEEQKLWQYALYSAAVLQGIGKLFVDYRINLFDANGHLLKQWNPLLESLTHTGTYYDYEFQKEPEQEFRRRINLLLAKALMPSSGFAWIASNPQVLAIWLALLHEDYYSAGTLGAILIRADALAIQRYLSEYKARSAHGRNSRPGTFIGGVPESITDKEKASGVEFIQWLIKALDNKLIKVNESPLFMVPEGLLMLPEMFQLFVRHNPEYKNWQAIQKGFLSLGFHSIGADGTVLSRLEQAKGQQSLSGVVFSKYATALPASVEVYQANTAKAATMSAMELIHNSRNLDQTAVPLQKLSVAGKWLNTPAEAAALHHGAKRGV